MNPTPAKYKGISTTTIIAILFSFALLIGCYVLFRYGDMRSPGGDARRFTAAINDMIEDNALIPANPYSNGYTFQAIIASSTSITGVSVSHFQFFGSVLFLPWVIFPAWLLYRELTGNSRIATVATSLLLIQPELLFVLTRGTHEKFTRGLMLLSIYLLVRSLRTTNRPALFASFVICFYLSAYGVISSNALLANSFILAVIFALLLCWFVMRERVFSIRPMISVLPVLQRFMFVCAICLILSFSFIFYVYPPAQRSLTFSQSITEQTAALVLDVEETEQFNPYAAIDTTWISREVYLVLTFSNWLLLGISAMIWLWQTISWIIRRQAPSDVRALLLWAFYGAFAMQGALSILADISGAVGNLQHRVFPTFTLFAVAVVAQALVQWRPKPWYIRRIAYAGISVFLGILAILSLLKATNEPLLSNKWLFHEAAEIQAIDWANMYLQEQRIWVGIDDRLATTYYSGPNDQNPTVSLDSWSVDRGIRSHLLSDVIRSRSMRVGAPLPIEMDSFRTYDNGQAQIYRLRPETPHQD